MVSGPVLVTGMAWTTALGDSLDGVWDALLDGATGIREVPSDRPLRSRLAAPVAGPRPALPTGLRERQDALAVRTVQRALDDADVPADHPGLRLVAGTSHGPHLDEDAGDLHDWAFDAADAVGIAASPVAVTTACSAGADAIMIGARLIRAGVTDVAVCGGVDVLSPLKRAGHSALGTMSSTALRAFHPGCDGTLLGEGAGFLVLESAASVQRRGAYAYAELRGTGSSNDATGMTAPDPTGGGPARAVHRCLDDAGGAGPGDVVVVNAHGSGTPANDRAEARTYGRLFAGADSPVVFATKGAFGHTLGATGALEAIATVLALRDGLCPPVPGLAGSVPTIPLPVAAGAALPVPDDDGTGLGLSLTLGFGGFNTCLAFAAAAACDPGEEGAR